MWFVLDNALVLPEYLVEFEYVTNLKGPNDMTPKTDSSKKLLADNADNAMIDECNKMFDAINGA
jgi:hypothetical protein